METRASARDGVSAGWGYPDPEGLADLQTEALRLILLGLVGLVWAIFAAMVAIFHRADPEGIYLAAGILGSVALGYRFLSLGARPATAVLALGVFATLALSLVLYPDGETAPLLSLVVLLTTALLGWRAGAIAAAASATAVLLLLPTAGAPTESPAAMARLVLFGTTALLTWLLSYPLRTALVWSWHSYLDGLGKTEQLREHQAELVSMSKSLSYALERLEHLTEQLERARRSAERARELKEQFAVAISHELRTPLNLIIGFSEMMVLTPEASYGERLPESYRGDLETIYCNAGHISNLIDDVLDLSQVDAQRLALQKEWVSPAVVVEEAVTAIATMVRDKRLGLDVELPNDLPPLYADPVRLRQVLINLLVNAVRFTDRGRITVSARADDDAVVVAVRDTGVGIPAGDLPRLFQDFRQVGEVERRHTGSGVGLAVSKRLVELHGGNMWAESQPGEGSTFSFSMPRRETVVAANVDPDWQTHAATVVRSGSVPTAVVVDDGGEMVRVFQRYLDGYRVIGVATLEEARRLVRDQAVHALIVRSAAQRQDWEELDLSEPLEQTVPVLVCPLRTRQDRVAELGLVDYLVKPVRREHLRQALRKTGGRMPGRILVVDDDAEMLRLLTRTVRSFSPRCRIRTARGGQEALIAMRESRPDVVLLDLRMPGGDGYTVLDALHREPVLARVPAIVVTGWSADDEAIVAGSLEIAQAGGLTVGQVMSCVKATLDALQALGPAIAPARPASSAASPAWAGSR